MCIRDRAPKIARNPLTGMNIAVAIAVVAKRMSRMPVFSVVPSIVIKLDS